jgi:KUP system potassium uptake protein
LCVQLELKRCILTWDIAVENIQSVGFCKTAIIKLFRSSCLLIHHEGETLLSLGGENGIPFYLIMADWFQPFGHNCNYGCSYCFSSFNKWFFTLINEAMRLNFWPKVRIKYPTSARKFSIFLLLTGYFLGCAGIVLHFEKSSNMEHAYGLAIILCMIMTTILLNFFLIMKGKIILYGSSYHNIC